MKIICPTVIYFPRKTMKPKKYQLTLNVYRNTHHIVLSKAKKMFTKQMRSQLEGLVLTTPIALEFRYFKGSRGIEDKANRICVIEKFFCDALVHYGCIPDDNDKYILYQKYLPTRYDKNKNRVEVKIIENVKPEEEE